MTTSDIVHVIDDDADVRESLAFLLGTAGMTVRVHESANSFLAALPEVKEGCIVTDVRMPGVDGIQLQRRLAAAGNRLPVIVMTGHGDVALAVEAMRAGAMDFIEKPFNDDVLIAAIRNALSRRAGDRERGAQGEAIRQRMKLLSERERQVMEGLVAGKPNKIIAYDLGISARTVEIYRANVMTKMQADSLSALLRMVLLEGGGD